MNHLVISVSAESSLELLGKYADVILLDRDTDRKVTESYETVHIRSHFSTPELQPLQYNDHIKKLVEQVGRMNPAVRFIDQMSDAESITAFEDKWHQYQLFSEYMPLTELIDTENRTAIDAPIYKKRLSSRGAGVQWVAPSADYGDWIVQESLAVAEELRVYVIKGEVYPVATIRQSKTQQQGVQATGQRLLVQHERDFALKISQKASYLDMVGLDIVVTENGALKLLEVNRSPGFAAFENLTGVNLADELYGKQSGGRRFTKDYALLCANILRVYAEAAAPQAEDIKQLVTHTVRAGSTHVHGFMYQGTRYYISDDYSLEDNPKWVEAAIRNFQHTLTGGLVKNPVPQSDGALYAAGFEDVEYYLWKCT